MATAILRGSFEYQGQCSPRRALVPPEEPLERRPRPARGGVPRIQVGDVTDFENFMGAVIGASYRMQVDAIDEARSPAPEIVAGGEADDSEGWFVRPAVL